jgi:hypothetical protein
MGTEMSPIKLFISKLNVIIVLMTQGNNLEKQFKDLENREFKDRLARLRELDEIITDETVFLPSSQSSIFFEEIKVTFVYGAFVACILLSYSFVLDWLNEMLIMIGKIDEHVDKSKELIELSRSVGFIDEKMRSELYELREIRHSYEHTNHAGEVLHRFKSGDKRLLKRYDPRFYDELKNDALKAIKFVVKLTGNFFI